jgi:putative ABC transport system ATP-binding protein
MDAVQIKRLTHRFGDGETAKPVLHGLGLTVAAGEVVLLTGPSGSGKTTLLTLIGGLRAVQEGSCIVLGTELAGADEATRVAVRRRIGFIFQHHNLLGFLTAQQNVAMALEIDARLSETERLARADAILEAVGIGEKARAYPATLSGGQRQRVAIARALVHEPGLILADEPTAALDARTGHETMELLQRLAKEQRRTVFIVTHDSRIHDIADRIVAMEDGHIIEEGMPGLPGYRFDSGKVWSALSPSPPIP